MSVFSLFRHPFNLRRLLVSFALLLSWPAANTALAAKTVLVFGDSLSAGYGIGAGQAWPDLLDARLRDDGGRFRVVNASISGETSAGGRARLDGAIDQFKPTVLILALGANDGLRGLPPAQMQDNLRAMVRLSKTRGIRVLLIGMKLPPNYGPDYTQAFEAGFSGVAKSEKTAWLPFLLAPIANQPEAFQADRLHPVAAVQARLLDHIYPALTPLLK
jgi:acyl-CoA thioesterase-1